MVEQEAWADVVGFEGLYQVSTAGRVKSINRNFVLPCGKRYFRSGKILAFNIKKNGLPYRRVKLCKDGVSSLHLVSRLVLSAFIRSPFQNEQACHNNSDPSDNRLENLRWDTPTGNFSDRHKNGTHPSGSKNGRSILNRSSVNFIRDSKLPHKTLSIHFGVSPKYISNLKSGINWSHSE